MPTAARPLGKLTRPARALLANDSVTCSTERSVPMTFSKVSADTFRLSMLTSWSKRHTSPLCRAEPDSSSSETISPGSPALSSSKTMPRGELRVTVIDSGPSAQQRGGTQRHGRQTRRAPAVATANTRGVHMASTTIWGLSVSRVLSTSRKVGEPGFASAGVCERWLSR